MSALSLALLPVAATRPADGPRVEIIHVGCHHPSEVSAQPGETWSALYRRGDGFELAPREIRVDPCRDMSDGPGEQSGRWIAVDTDVTPLFLVRGLGSIGSEPQIIAAAKYESPPEYLHPGERFKLSLGSAVYEIAAEGKYDPSRPPSDALVVQYRLVLKAPDRRSQDLEVPKRFAEDGVPVLLWAGDLDGDKKLDLYMDLTDHYNVRDYTLFLSSRAGTDQLVKKVASRRYVGC